jgi:hypothetical protein
MITFENIDEHLKSLDKNRSWLAEASGRSPSSIRSALAPNAPEKQRSPLLLKALTDAIVREQDLQRAQPFPLPATLPDRITIECTPEERREWERAAMLPPSPQPLDEWIHGTLNHAAEHWLATRGLDVAEAHDGDTQPAGNAKPTTPTIYPGKNKPTPIDREREA